MPTMRREWFRFENAVTDPSVVDIHIIDFIGDWIDDYFGFGVTARQFVDELNKLPDSVRAIRLHINSPGGDVHSAVNIANALRDQRLHRGRSVEVLVEGLAASAATLPMMAGDPIKIADNAQVFVHNPWTVVAGQANGLRKMADDLDKIRDAIIATYQWHSPLSAEELGALMDAETMMTADEAITAGFATEKVVGLKAAASLDPRIVARLPVPERYRSRLEPFIRKDQEPFDAPVPPRPEPAPAAQVLAEVESAGLGAGLARELIEAALPMDQARARIQEAKAAKDAAEARARDIRAICERGKVPQLADGLIRSGMTLADVRAHVATVTALLDKVEIDAGLQPDEASAAASWKDVIAKVNGRKGVSR